MAATNSGATRQRPVILLGAIALIVFALDLASKRWALANLDGSDRWFGESMRFTLLHNHGLAWGLSLGTLTPLGTALATAVLVALMLRVCRELAAVDSLAPVMLGLLAGAGLSNGLDVFLGPSGVVDFIALPFGQQEAVLNVADVAAAIGIALCGRTGYVLARAIVTERRRIPVLAMPAGARAGVALEVAREVPLFFEVPSAPVPGTPSAPSRPSLDVPRSLPLAPGATPE